MEGTSIVRASPSETISLTCIVAPASDLTIIEFGFNNTIYRDSNFIGESYYGITVNSTYHNDSCSVESTLFIEDFSEEFAGQYNCSAFIFGTGGAKGKTLIFNVRLTNVGGDEQTGIIMQSILYYEWYYCIAQRFDNGQL